MLEQDGRRGTTVWHSARENHKTTAGLRGPQDRPAVSTVSKHSVRAARDPTCRLLQVAREPGPELTLRRGKADGENGARCETGAALRKAAGERDRWATGLDPNGAGAGRGRSRGWSRAAAAAAGWGGSVRPAPLASPRFASRRFAAVLPRPARHGRSAAPPLRVSGPAAAGSSGAAGAGGAAGRRARRSGGGGGVVAGTPRSVPREDGHRVHAAGAPRKRHQLERSPAAGHRRFPSAALRPQRAARPRRRAGRSG